MGVIIITIVIIGLLAYIFSKVFPIVAWSLLILFIVFLIISAVNRFRVIKRDGNTNQQNTQRTTNTANVPPTNFNNTNTEIALELFEPHNAGGEVGKAAQRISKTCSNRHELLLKIIELCGDDPLTPKELYIVSGAYVQLGAKYRPQAIEYLEKYIATRASFGSVKENAVYRKAAVYKDLGEAYEGEYQFDKAEQAYLMAEKIDPDTAAYSVCVSRIYTKTGDLHKALEYLNSKKATKNYLSNFDEYRTVIDTFIDETEEKIKKGYVYKPRNKGKVKQQIREETTIDFSALDRIRADAEITCNMLMSPENEDPDSMPDIPEEQHQENHSVLDNIEKKFLSVLLENGNIKEFAKENDLILSITSEKINGKLFDIIGDVVIEFQNDIPYILEDYKDEVVKICTEESEE